MAVAFSEGRARVNCVVMLVERVPKRPLFHLPRLARGFSMPSAGWFGGGSMELRCES